ncbi:hypothetical protein [Tsukamurella spumae]|uniref:Uncharacterized protein n=1 Tax=Tsukamurella spumae TaxID=44753 RepID=A0A846X144_9ACTN|nr:hypothetical protein [Tsukamurella spumae]NKY19208.1 hypothetical protein [Tsukamurella spumae]
MALHVDCSTCPGEPRACGDCSVGFLLGPVVAAAPPVEAPPAPVIVAEPGLNDAIAAFASQGMLPRLRVVSDQYEQAG